jgi:hypothetical protein
LNPDTDNTNYGKWLRRIQRLTARTRSCSVSRLTKSSSLTRKDQLGYCRLEMNEQIEAISSETSNRA